MSILFLPFLIIFLIFVSVLVIFCRCCDKQMSLSAGHENNSDSDSDSDSDSSGNRMWSVSLGSKSNMLLIHPLHLSSCSPFTCRGVLTFSLESWGGNQRRKILKWILIGAELWAEQTLSVETQPVILRRHHLFILYELMIHHHLFEIECFSLRVSCNNVLMISSKWLDCVGHHHDMNILFLQWGSVLQFCIFHTCIIKAESYLSSTATATPPAGDPYPAPPSASSRPPDSSFVLLVIKSLFFLLPYFVISQLMKTHKLLRYEDVKKKEKINQIMEVIWPDFEISFSLLFISCDAKLAS